MENKEYVEIVMPQINVNDDEVTITEIRFKNNDYVKVNDILFGMETAKMTEDYSSETSGFIIFLVKEGEKIPVGGNVCRIFKDKQSESSTIEKSEINNSQVVINASKKALEYAKQTNFDLSLIKKDGIVKVEDIIQYEKINQKEVALNFISESLEANYKMNDIIIWGAGGQGKICIDIIESQLLFNIIGIIDDGLKDNEIGDIVLGKYFYLGGKDLFQEYYDKGVKLVVIAIGAINNNKSRWEHFNFLKGMGFIIPNIIHSKAIVELSVKLGEGIQILAGAVVGSCAKIGDNCIISCNTVVSHDCILDYNVHITPGATLAGNVKVGYNSVIGMNTSIYIGVHIEPNKVIHNGSNILK